MGMEVEVRVGVGRCLSPKACPAFLCPPKYPWLLWLSLGPLNHETFQEVGLHPMAGPMTAFQRILFGVTHKDRGARAMRPDSKSPPKPW